ncbi:MAG: helix-turn-helix domain-containing protein [Candidatus Thorarchaeota archaeon]
MLAIIYQDSFWIKLIKKIINREECKYWDFKEDLKMWNTLNSFKDDKQIKFCEKVAAFTNKKGRVIILGITDKIPRDIIGIPDIENKLQSMSTILNKWIDYQEDYFELKEVIIKDSNNIDKRCIAIVIAQVKEPIGVRSLNGSYSYPVRLETGLYKEDISRLRKKKRGVINTNFNFLHLLNNGF